MQAAKRPEDRPPDLRGPAIVIRGGVIGGFTFHGPFETIEAAYQWNQGTFEGKLELPCSIAILESPALLAHGPKGEG